MVVMEKNIFKARMLDLLQQDVVGLSSGEKIEYMKRLLRAYESNQQKPPETGERNKSMKVGILVQRVIRQLARSKAFSEEKVRLLQDTRYCKETFDINYPLLKKVVWDIPISEQKKINGYNRYWAEAELINGERYLVCSQWYDRNKRKFINWLNLLEKSLLRGRDNTYGCYYSLG